MKVTITIEADGKTASYSEVIKDSIEIEQLMERCKSNLSLAAAMATLHRISKS